MGKKAILRAIRKKCLECCGGSRKEVAECELEDCPLHPYRFGREPEKESARHEDSPSTPSEPV